MVARDSFAAAACGGAKATNVSVTAGAGLGGALGGVSAKLGKISRRPWAVTAVAALTPQRNMDGLGRAPRP